MGDGDEWPLSESAAEVRVSGRAGGKNFTTIIAVEKNLAGALDEAAHFTGGQFGR